MTDNKSTICVLVLCTAILCSASAVDDEKVDTLHDGFFLAGVDGKLTAGDNKWLFELDSDLSDGKNRLCAGAGLELLPSAALETMTADVKARRNAQYRLWGKVTKYKGANFVFPLYFLPLSAVEKKDLQKPEPPRDINISEADDVLSIPEAVLQKLSTRRVAQPELPPTGIELKADYILTDRTGFIVTEPNDSEPEIENSIFVLDTLGRAVESVRFELLGCEALERARQQQSGQPDLIRFKIAGIVTQYQGRNYLLLQRVIRAYSHENFDR